MGFSGIKNLLPQSIRRAGITKQIDANLTLHIYEKIAKDILGEEISRQTKPLYVKNNILTIACLSSLIMQELRYKEGELVERINKEMGSWVIKKLNYIS